MYILVTGNKIFDTKEKKEIIKYVKENKRRRKEEIQGSLNEKFGGNGVEAKFTFTKDFPPTEKKN